SGCRPSVPWSERTPHPQHPNDVRLMSASDTDFNWTDAATNAALSLATGHTQAEAAEEAGVTDRTIRRWLNDPEFAAEVDRLTLMSGISTRAERLRIAMRVARQKVREETGEILTTKDILDWLKFAQSETDGVKLD